MSQCTISWANVCRKANGEQLIFVNGRFETERRGRRLLKQTFRLLALPFDVREDILKQCLEFDIIAVFLPGRGPYSRPPQIPLPAIARAGNKQLRLEMIRVVLLNTTWSINSGPGNVKFQKWLASLDFSTIETSLTNGFDAVKHLHFPFFSRFPHIFLPPTAPNNDIELMRKCKQLSKITLIWVLGEVLHQGVSKPAATLVTQYRLAGILEPKELEVIDLRGGFLVKAVKCMVDLKEWFEEEFERKKEMGERKRGVKVLLNGV